MSDTRSATQTAGVAPSGGRRMALGGAVWIGGFVLIFQASALGLDAVRPFIPFLLVGGVIVFATGLHKVLWAPPRDKMAIPAALRPIISGAIAVALSMCLSFVGGAVLGYLRAHH